MNRWPPRAGPKAPINRTHSKRFALAAESAEDASAFGVRASSAPLSQGNLRFDGRAGSCQIAMSFAQIGMPDREGGVCELPGREIRSVRQVFWLLKLAAVLVFAGCSHPQPGADLDIINGAEPES